MTGWVTNVEHKIEGAASPVVRTIKRGFSMLPTLPWYVWAGAAAFLAVFLGARAAGATAALPPGPERPEGAPPLLKLGATGLWVSYLQSLLGVPLTSTFDADTDAAVRAFQATSAPPADGIVGHDTWTALGVSGSAAPSGGGPGPSPQPHPQPNPPGPAPTPTTGNPFGLAELPPQREPQMLALIQQGKFAHDWEPLDYTTADGHKVHVLASRFALALKDGSDRLIVSMTFNGAQQAIDLLGGAMLTSRIADEIWKQASTKISFPNKPWNTDVPVTGGKLSRMYDQSNDIQQKVAQAGGGQEGFVASEGKDWVITRRFWTNAQGGTNGNLPTDKPNAPAGVPGSPHNAANFGGYGPFLSHSAGGVPVAQSIGLAHDRGNAGGFVDYSQLVRMVKPDSLTIDGVPWDWGAALADPTVSSYIQDEGGTIPSPRHPDLA